MFNTILVAIDGSEHSKRALETGCDLCARYDAKLHVLHVPQALAQEKTLVLGAAAVTVHASPEEIEKAGRSVMEAARQLVDSSDCTDVETEIASGDPAHVIVATVERIGADLVVMGRRGLSDLVGLVVGSTSHKVAHLAPCACLTTR